MTPNADLGAPDSPSPDSLNYDAWVLLANAEYWDHTDPQRIAEWHAARDRWRDRFHATLSPNDGKVSS